MAGTQTATLRPFDTTLEDDAKASNNQLLREALEADKREALLLAVKARWVALAIIAVLLLIIVPWPQVLYYEVLVAGFAVIGWAQFKLGRVGASRPELVLLFCDLALMTFTLVYPNPFFVDLEWPVALQYRFGNFIYFFILLAGATLAYSWRTVFAVGTWTSGLWMAGLIWAYFQPHSIEKEGEAIRAALADHPHLIEFFDPNVLHVEGRIQEVVLFVVVAGILALNSWRNNRLLLRQADLARERANLARHFPPSIVSELADRDQPLGAVRDQSVAVMFADIVGFTQLAESKTADQVVDILRAFHGRMERAVFDNGGTLDKFLGDGLMATFGTPDTGPADATNALRCGQAMLAAVDQWNAERKQAGEDPIPLSVGIHYGPVVLGDIGSERRLEFAVLGDAVNVASRLESVTRDLGARLAVSDDLISAVGREAAADKSNVLAPLTNRGPHQLRGRNRPITVWTG